MHYKDLSKEKSGSLFHKFVDGRLDSLHFKYILIAFAKPNLNQKYVFV